MDLKHPAVREIVRELTLASSNGFCRPSLARAEEMKELTTPIRVRSVHINDEERYIQVGTQDGEQMLLKPKTSESYALWVLGLNAALACARGASVPTEIINNMPWAL